MKLARTVSAKKDAENTLECSEQDLVDSKPLLSRFETNYVTEFVKRERSLEKLQGFEKELLSEKRKEASKSKEDRIRPRQDSKVKEAI